MAQDTNNNGSPKENHTEALKAVGEYWTEERRRAAKPYPLPRGTPPAHTGAQAAAPAETGTTPHGHGSEHTAHEKTEGAAFGVANPLIYPFRTVGKIYFNQGTGGFSGSAAMVAPNVLLTAGHCVYSGGKWSTNMVFYPSYGKRAATDPLNHVACGRLTCKQSWIDHGDRPHDYGLVWMPTSPGNTVGWLGLLWNAPTNGRTWTAVGYPSTPNPPFNGESMQEAIGTMKSNSGGVIGLNGDNMEHGSSGGPWITAWGNDAAPGAHANGLQSFHNADGDQFEYGPYFTQEIQDLFTWLNQPANHW